jgi:hypothetical protein
MVFEPDSIGLISGVPNGTDTPGRTMKSLKTLEGQILIPGLIFVWMMILGFLMFVYWGQRRVQQMRLNMIADAAALSAARDKAETLNDVCVENVVINKFMSKARVPFTGIQAGEISIENYPAFTLWRKGLRAMASSFNSQAALTGYSVARANGITEALYSPFETGSLLVPMTVHLFIVSKTPPGIVERDVNGAYFARSWSPGFHAAQPPHRSTWVVNKEGMSAASSSQLWLDASPADRVNNGGFPRVNETAIRDVLVQGFYPQFNARLAALPSLLQSLVISEGSGL